MWKLRPRKDKEHPGFISAEVDTGSLTHSPAFNSYKYSQVGWLQTLTSGAERSTFNKGAEHEQSRAINKCNCELSLKT